MTTAVTTRDPHAIMAEATINAKSALIPKALQGRPQDIYVIIDKGRDFGFSPQQSMTLINVIQGVPTLSAGAIAALCSGSPKCEYLHYVDSESDDTKVTYVTKRKGAPSEVRITYTLEDARRAGLATRDNWKRMPREMLTARAISRIARIVYPDILMGFYSTEEMADAAPKATVIDAEDGKQDVSEAKFVPDQNGESVSSAEPEDHRSEVAQNDDAAEDVRLSRVRAKAKVMSADEVRTAMRTIGDWNAAPELKRDAMQILDQALKQKTVGHEDRAPF